MNIDPEIGDASALHDDCVVGKAGFKVEAESCAFGGFNPIVKTGGKAMAVFFVAGKKNANSSRLNCCEYAHSAW